MVTAEAPINLKGEQESEGNVASSSKRKVHRWTVEENQKLESLVLKAWPNVRWPLIAQELPGRTGKQCRERWMNARPGNKKGAWSTEEEKTIAKLHSEMGPAWSKIAKVLPGRTENDTKNHWNALLRCKTLEARQDSILGLYVLLVRNGSDPNPATFQQALASFEEINQGVLDADGGDQDELETGMPHTSIHGTTPGPTGDAMMMDEAVLAIQDEASSVQRMHELTQELTSQLEGLANQQAMQQLQQVKIEAQQVTEASMDASMMGTSRAAPNPAADALMATSSPCSANGPALQEAFASNPMQSLEMACKVSRQAAMERAMLGGGLNNRLMPNIAGPAGSNMMVDQDVQMGMRVPSPSLTALLAAPGGADGEGMLQGGSGRMQHGGSGSQRMQRPGMEKGVLVDVPPAGHMMMADLHPHDADLPLDVMTPARNRMPHGGMPGAPMRGGPAWDAPVLSGAALSRFGSRIPGLPDDMLDAGGIQAIAASRSQSGLMGRQPQMMVRPTLRQLGLDGGGSGMLYGGDNAGDNSIDDSLRPTPRMLSWSTRRDPLLAMRLNEMRQSLRGAYVNEEDAGGGWGGEVADDMFPDVPQQRSASFPRGQPPSAAQLEMGGYGGFRGREGGMSSALKSPPAQTRPDPFLEKCLREGMVMSQDSYGVIDPRMEHMVESDSSYPANMLQARRPRATDMGYMQDPEGRQPGAPEVQRVSAVKRASTQDLGQDYMGLGAASGLKRQNSSLRGSTVGPMCGGDSPHSNAGMASFNAYQQAFASTSVSQGPPTDTDARSHLTPSDPPSDSIPSDLRAKSGMMGNLPPDLFDELLGNPGRLGQENAAMRTLLERPLSAETPGWQVHMNQLDDGPGGLSSSMRSLQVQVPPAQGARVLDLASPGPDYGASESAMSMGRRQTLSFTQGLTNSWGGVRGFIERPTGLSEERAAMFEERLAMMEGADEGVFVLGTSGGSFTAGYTGRQAYAMRQRGRNTPRSLQSALQGSLQGKRGFDNISRLARSTTMHQDPSLVSPFGIPEMQAHLQQSGMEGPDVAMMMMMQSGMRPLSSPAGLPNMPSAPVMGNAKYGQQGMMMQAGLHQFSGGMHVRPGDAADLCNPMESMLHLEGSGTRGGQQQHQQQLTGQQSSSNSRATDTTMPASQTSRK